MFCDISPGSTDSPVTSSRVTSRNGFLRRSEINSLHVGHTATRPIPEPARNSPLFTNSSNASYNRQPSTTPHIYIATRPTSGDSYLRHTAGLSCGLHVSIICIFPLNISCQTRNTILIKTIRSGSQRRRTFTQIATLCL